MASTPPPRKGRAISSTRSPVPSMLVRRAGSGSGPATMGREASEAVGRAGAETSTPRERSR
ncbi:hypothetical protein ACN28I_45750 [Archangium gephyra]|uniref:hypothetical protein n=1 Tax=Archangium gephyra TaxID=48 RepID=UPI003B788097